MSSREPMWYCHQCHAEMRPLMIPDPHCASCRSTFVEVIDNPADDPRHEDLLHPFLGAQNDPHDVPDDGAPHPAAAAAAGGMPNILEALSNLFTNSDQNPTDGRQEPRADHLAGGAGVGSGGLRIIINTPSGTRSLRFGGGTGNRQDDEGRPPLLSEFLASHTIPNPADPNQPQESRRTPAPLLASYLLSNLFGRVPVVDGHGGVGMFDPFESLAGGRYGDYVVNEQALQNIMNELLGNAGGQPADPPAPEEVIENLPRIVLDETNPHAGESCSICHEPFNPMLAASPDAFSSSSTSSGAKDDDDDGPSLVGVTLPCEHTFHEDCILPWMKMKSTCPVCRKSVLPGSSSQGSSSNADRPSPAQQERSSTRRHGGDGENNVPGAWDALD